jgi:hypothetical protein
MTGPGFVILQPLKRHKSLRMVFIRQHPRSHDGSIDNEGHQCLCPSWRIAISSSRGTRGIARRAFQPLDRLGLSIRSIGFRVLFLSSSRLLFKESSSAARFVPRRLFLFRAFLYAGVRQHVPEFFRLCRLCRYPGAAGRALNLGSKVARTRTSG